MTIPQPLPICLTTFVHTYIIKWRLNSTALFFHASSSMWNVSQLWPSFCLPIFSLLNESREWWSYRTGDQTVIWISRNQCEIASVLWGLNAFRISLVQLIQSLQKNPIQLNPISQNWGTPSCKTASWCFIEASENTTLSLWAICMANLPNCPTQTQWLCQAVLTSTP